MIQTIRDYPYLTKYSDKGESLSDKIRERVDVYFNREEKNWIVCMKGKIDILIEFPTRQEIDVRAVKEAVLKNRRGGVHLLREETNLEWVAKQARKEKENEKFHEEERHHLNDAGKYEFEGKRSVVVGG
ncbi:MAG: hypothetical protein WC455_19970 [Dehalococcoidia bacterium]|jgi:hypothetical protein